MFNVILFSDAPSPSWFSRGYGAYRLSSELRKNGYTTLVVDFSSGLPNDTFKKIIDKCVTEDTLFVGFSTTWFPYRQRNLPNARYIVGFHSLGTDEYNDPTDNIHNWYSDTVAFGFTTDHLNEYVNYIKNANPKTKVIVGGAKSYEYVFEPNLDNVFVGYSENQLIDYANTLSGKGPKRIFNKIVNYDVKAQSGSFVFNESTTSYQDVDCLLPHEVLTIEFSRGCIFNCAFCSYPHRNQDTRDYVKYKEIIRKELIENWEQWGSYKYVITDDTFNDYTEKLILVNEVIQTLPFKPIFWAYIRLDLISRNPEQAQLIKDIGVREVYYGLETWHDETAKIIKKGGSKTKKIEGMRIAKECWGNDVYVIAGTVVGLPNDTEQSVKEATEWYIAEGHKYIDLFAHSPFTLRDLGEAQDYIFQSDIEQNMEGYGYSFPDNENNPLAWIRNDSGDIVSKDVANTVAAKYNKLMEPYWSTYSFFWDRSKLWEGLDVDTSNSVATFYKHVTERYFPSLLARLNIT
jgi:hypothetical protein